MKRLLLALPLMMTALACAPAPAPTPEPAPAAVEAPAPAPVAARKPVNLIIMYNLKPGVTPADFEAWVKSTDQPAMRGLARVADFQTLRAEKLLMGDGKPSVTYIETFSITDLDGFVAEDMPGATVQGVMGQFMGFADAPQFIVVSEVQ
jgi:hypothetical protein